jgi:uncharacterized SAM-binding protein YcdF (DUF218 family)
MIWLACALLAAIQVSLLSAQIFSAKRPIGVRMLWLKGVTVAVLVVGTVLFWPGLLSAQREVANLLMPTGLIWLGLLTLSALAALQRRWGSFALSIGLTLLLTIAGSGWIAGQLIMQRERPFADTDPLARRELDAVCVLGGGVSRGPGGRAMLNAAGDRIALAARLYLRGCTGQIAIAGGDPDQPLTVVADPTETILLDLGVPPAAICRFYGVNTLAEIDSIADLKRDRGWTRTGIVTSAWHMSRALRLAEQAEVKLIPLPADFLTNEWPEGTESSLLERLASITVVPKADAVAITRRVAWEWLAAVAGR